ncbi:nucleotide-binding universal stress UspA family protein [Gillisia mitskevichiae]|uniref:Nucleotide-binding universal stress UspA family protein n=1 Tax=Gillisia mitskevichiae TaxID=270921 RepID=A0A495PTW7_9FLAO|nr:universal stress protein [Gillisia mitskevichiae]RKS53667.1 nucleotide-binding universal stress UspA family protein [Gillisia mitskevichiae]
MKTILVPVDFSEYSEYALEVAASLAKKNDAKIIVVHLLGLSNAFLSKDEAEEVFNGMYYMKLAKKRFDEFLDKPYLKDIEVIDAIRNYKVFSEINEIAKEFQAELIVMGSQGATGFAEMFIGSNTEKVIRTSEIPVLVVKESMKNFSIKKAIFVSDLELESVNVYIKARNFLLNLDSEMEILFINQPEKFHSSSEMYEKFYKFLDATKLNELEPPTIKFYDDYSLESGVYNYCKSNEADIVIMPTHGRKGLSHFFYGSYGEDVANHATMPVLTMKI